MSLSLSKYHVTHTSRDVFTLLAQANWIDGDFAQSLKYMVGFCHIAVHDDKKLQLPITLNVITQHLNELIQFSSAILKKDNP